MKAFKYILSSLIPAIALGVIMFAFFVGYGGNNCDQPQNSACDCFCCHSFNSRGYEACGLFGFYTGSFIGGLGGLAGYYLLSKRGKKNKS